MLVVARLPFRCSGLGTRLHLGAVDKVDRRIEDDLISGLDSAVHFHPGAEIALDSHLADLHPAAADDERQLRSVTVEDERVGRH
jgi:hypothetical protein